MAAELVGKACMGKQVDLDLTIKVHDCTQPSLPCMLHTQVHSPAAHLGAVVSVLVVLLACSEGGSCRTGAETEVQDSCKACQPRAAWGAS